MENLCRVLIVDDEEDLRDILELIYTRCGTTVETAANGQEALEKCQSQTFDLIVSDYHMPQMDGLSFLKNLRSKPSPHRPKFLLISGSIDLESAEQDLLNQHADGVISKPFQAQFIYENLTKLFPEKKFKNVK